MSRLSKVFSKNLTKIRKQRGLSQNQLSEISGLSQRTITHYENHVTEPPIDKIEILASALNVNVSELLGLADLDIKSVDTSFDVRTLKKFKELANLDKRDRLTVYRMIDALSRSTDFKKKPPRLKVPGH